MTVPSGGRILEVTDVKKLVNGRGTAMAKRYFGALVALVLAAVLVERAYPVVISEFMALNKNFMADEDGDTSDWIELYNEQSTTVNLSGWSLSDDPGAPRKWVFPAVEIPPGEFLLVFASGKDKRKPDGELHTNFELLSEGEFLALYDPRGQVRSLFSPKFPEQVFDSSYGISMTREETDLIPEGAQVRYFVPRDSSLEDTWAAPDFDDSSWSTGQTGIGFDQRSNPLFASDIRTDIGDAMRRVNASVYIRITFEMPADKADSMLLLRMKFADGFVAYLNGVEVLRENAPSTVRYSSRARRSRSAQEALKFSVWRIQAQDLIKQGTNVLAIQGMNNSRSDDDFYILPILKAVKVTAVNRTDYRYFDSPSPRLPNEDGYKEMARRPVFSVTSSTHQDPFQLEITSPDGGEIRYTLDWKTPTISSPLYTEPLTIDSTVMVRARVFKEGMMPSPIVTESYVFLHSSLYNFTSNLPIVIINMFGRPIPGTGTIGFPVTGHMYVIEHKPAGEGGKKEAHMTDPPDFAGIIGIKVRGSSTANRPKQSFSIEIQDPDGPPQADLDATILGLPPDSDFVLYGAYNFDHALMRNALIYELSRQCGRYAARTRFCEVWINRGSGPVSTAHYMGVYWFGERLTRSPYRINVTRLLPTDNEEPAITGGYIIKQDRKDPGEQGFSAGGYNSLVWVDPDEPEVTPAQRVWLINYINKMSQAIRTRNPREYEKYIDVDAWIDHHILNVFPKNVDAFRLSGYMYKDRGGKMVLGPIWDYDRSMGSTDGRDRYWDRWENTGGDGGTPYFSYGWYGPLFGNRPPLGNDEWAVRYRARWRQLRGGPLSTENVMAVIDRMAAEIGEAATRNWQKWRQGSSNFQVSVNQLKNWLSNRLEWIDRQFIEPPAFSPQPGQVQPGTQVTITALEGTIYYTINGPDPRRTSTQPAPEALIYDGPITVNDNIRIRARTRVSERVWSEMTEGVFYTHLLPLVVTEVMYRPSPATGGSFSASQYEFLEIFNRGNQPVSLAGVSFTQGVTFDFREAAFTTLEPQGYAVVVRNIDAFAQRYQDTSRVLGEFSGTLSNSGETITLSGPVGEPLLSFRYSGSWYPEASGGGYSIVIKDPAAPRDSWSQADSWRLSFEPGGSPGREDLPPVKGLQLPGDFNQDGRLTVSDAFGLLRYLFGVPVPLPCRTPAGNTVVLDLNVDGAIDLADVTYLLRYLFVGGPPPVLGTSCIPVTGCEDACSAAE